MRDPHLQILRTTATLSTTALFIPLMGHLMAVFNCEGKWLQTGWECYQGSHLGLVMATLVIVVMFTMFSLIGAPMCACVLTCICVCVCLSYVLGMCLRERCDALCADVKCVCVCVL